MPEFCLSRWDFRPMSLLPTLSMPERSLASDLPLWISGISQKPCLNMPVSSACSSVTNKILCVLLKRGPLHNTQVRLRCIIHHSFTPRGKLLMQYSKTAKKKGNIVCAIEPVVSGICSLPWPRPAYEIGVTEPGCLGYLVCFQTRHESIRSSFSPGSDLVSGLSYKQTGNRKQGVPTNLCILIFPRISIPRHCLLDFFRHFSKEQCFPVTQQGGRKRSSPPYSQKASR